MAGVNTLGVEMRSLRLEKETLVQKIAVLIKQLARVEKENKALSKVVEDMEGQRRRHEQHVSLLVEREREAFHRENTALVKDMADTVCRCNRIISELAQELEDEREQVKRLQRQLQAGPARAP